MSAAVNRARARAVQSTRVEDTFIVERAIEEPSLREQRAQSDPQTERRRGFCTRERPGFWPTIERDGRAATTVFDESSKVSMCGRREAQHRTLDAMIERSREGSDRRRGERKNPPLRARYESSTMERRAIVIPHARRPTQTPRESGDRSRDARDERPLHRERHRPSNQLANGRSRRDARKGRSPAVRVSPVKYPAIVECGALATALTRVRCRPSGGRSACRARAGGSA